jgi:hypothetical protein
VEATVKTILLFCDDASHKLTRPQVYVTTFTRGPLGWGHDSWEQQGRMKPAATDWLDGEQLMGAAAPDRSWLHGSDPRDPAKAERLKVRLRCRSCRQRPVNVRAGKLDAALDQVADTGRESLTMSELRAILDLSGRES